MNRQQIQQQIDRHRARIEHLQSILDDKDRLLNKEPNERPFFELTIGHTKGCNLDPDTDTLITTTDSNGHRTLWIPVPLNDRSIQGKPFKKKRYFRGKLVTNSKGEPVYDTVTPSIVGRTTIRSCTIPFRDGTLTGFASVQASALSCEEIEERMNAQEGTSLDHAYTVAGVQPDTEMKLTSPIPSHLTVTDDTDDITTTHEFTPSEQSESRWNQESP